MRQLILALLRSGATHGYELKRAYDELFAPAWPEINVGQIYVTLRRLERDDLVTHRVESGGSGPDRKVYALTERGDKELDTWLEETSEPATGRTELVLRLTAAWLTDRAAVPAIVSAHRQVCLQGLRDLEGLAGRSRPGTLADLLVQSAGLHLQADLRFLDLVDDRADLRPRASPPPPRSEP